MSILKLKDSQGNWVGVPTLKGDNGNGISSAVLNNDYTLTLTFTDGTTYTTPSIRGEKGEKGEPATDMEIHICSASEYDSETRIPTIANPNDKTFYLVPTEDGTSPDLFTEWVYVNGAWEMFGSMKIDLSGYLTDVQVNGTSIVSDNIANIPLANSDKFGVVKINGNYGIQKNSSNLAVINRGNDSEIKIGTNSYKPIVPYSQHMATFYGLAKAAGADEKDSTLAFGTYSDNAKSSIQDMLGITDKYSPKEWIAESETELVANAHSVGDLFYIGETLYKVITDLKAGDAVNVGVNVEEVNTNDILDDYATKEDVQDNVSIVEKSASGAVASFDDGLDNIPLKELVVDINPTQDLHGYDKPWIGGTGKNLFQTTMQSTTVNGVTVTVNSDGSVKFTGTPTGNIGTLVFGTLTLPAGTYKANGFALGERTASRMVVASPDVSVFYANVYGGLDVEFTLTEETELRVYPIIGTSDYQDGETFYPMIRKASETDATFTPYENICPINGWTEANIPQTGKNLLALPVIRFNDGTATVDNCFYLKQGTYTLSYSCADTHRFGVRMMDANGTIYTDYSDTPISGFTYNSSAKCYYAGANIASGNKAYTMTIKYDCYVRIVSNLTGGGFTDVQLEIGNTATEYEPYKGRIINVNWETEAGTVYGGKLDVLSGVMRVNRKIRMVDTISNVASSYIHSDGVDGYVLDSDIQPRLNPLLQSTQYCNKLKFQAKAIWTSGVSEPNVFAINQNQIHIKIANDLLGITDYTQETTTTAKEKLNAWLAENPVTLTIPIEPIEVQLDAHTINSLYGQNNIFADTGDISCEYFSQVDKDLVDYIKANLNSYAKEEKLNDYVSDVQIDGTSIVSDGVANVPIASLTSLGLMKVGSGLMVSSSGIVKILPSDNDLNKIGTDINRPITPSTQHSSTFYGLTKAAGVDMSSSSNVVGIYTDEAKTAIKQMLGVHDTYDSFVEEITGTDVTITGQPSYRYNCGEVLSLTVTPPETGTIDFRFTSGSSPTVLTLPSTVKMPEWWVEVEANTIYEMCITDGIYCGVMTWAM